MALTNTLSALTREKFMPILVDNIFNSNALCLKLLKNADKLDGGSKIVVPIEYATNANTGWLSYTASGSATLSGQTAQAITDIAQRSEWNWATAYSAVLINGEELKMNEGSNRVLSIMKARMSNAEKSIRDTFGTGLFNDGAVSDGLTSLNGSGTAAAGDYSGASELIDTPTATDMFHAPGNENNTVCGYNRELGIINSDTNTWWDAKVGSFGTLSASVDSSGADSTACTFAEFTNPSDGVADGVIKMTQMYGACSVDSDQPDLIVTSQVIYDAYESSLQANKRFEGDSTLADAGFQTLRFKGASVVVDSHCPAGHMYFLNTKYLDFKVHSKRNFEFENFRNLEANDVMQARIFWMGQLVCSNPSRQGLLVGGPTGY